MTVEQTLVLIKPDGMMKGLVGHIMMDLNKTGLELVGTKIVKVSRDLAEEHYKALKEQKFFEELIQFIMGDFHVKKVLALVYQGEDACKVVREVIGSTNPEEAHPTSIRGRFGRITSDGVFENVVHASENTTEAEREIKLWFMPDDLLHTIYPTEEKNIDTPVKMWA